MLVIGTKGKDHHWLFNIYWVFFQLKVFFLQYPWFSSYSEGIKMIYCRFGDRRYEAINLL